MKRTLAILVAAVLFLGMFAIAASAVVPAINTDYEVTFWDDETGAVFDPVNDVAYVGQTIRIEYIKLNPSDLVLFPVTDELFVWYLKDGGFTDLTSATVAVPSRTTQTYTFTASDYGKSVTAGVISDNSHTGTFISVAANPMSLDQFIGGEDFTKGTVTVKGWDVVDPVDLKFQFRDFLQDLVEAKLVKNEDYGALFSTNVRFRTLVENAEDTDLQAKLDAAWAAAYALNNASSSGVPAKTTLAWRTLLDNFQKAFKALKDSTSATIDLQMARTQAKLENLLKSLKALQALDRLNEESTYKLTLAIAQTTDAIAWTKAKIRSYNQFTPLGGRLKIGGTPGKLEDATTAQEWLMDLWTRGVDMFGAPAYEGEFARDVLEVADAAAMKAAEDAAKAAEADKEAAEKAAKEAQDLADTLREIVKQLEARQPKLVAIDNIYNFFYGLIGANFFTDALSWVTRNLLFGWLWSPIKYSVSY